MRVLKWRVPVDSQWHPVGSGPVAHVGLEPLPWGGPAGFVTVWTIEPEGFTVAAAQVFTTGQPLSADVEHLGSAIDDLGNPAGRRGLVWHVFRSATQGLVGPHPV